MVGDFSFGAGSAGGSRAAQTRGRIQGGNAGVNYPSPFFDIAHTYLPVTVKQMFRWCRYYFLTNPVINAVVFKLSEYPITDIIIDHEDPKVVELWTTFFQEHLGYRSTQVDVNLDYHCYGNSLTSIGYPFRKYLTCRGCGFSEQAQKIRTNWVFTNFEFRLNCPRCHVNQEAIPEDRYFKNASGIKIIRWNCENVEVTYNDITGDCTHFFDIPPAIRNDVVIGKKDVVESTPQVFIQAMRQQKGIIFNKSNFFHMKRPTLAQQDRGWGIPLILPVLKDTFYLQIMKKAQEQILLEHIVPLRILFPQAGSGSSDPFTTINLMDWRDHVAAEIARWRMDPNYIPILPLPIGNQSIGGDGKALLLNQEMQMVSEQIINGMQVPIEFIKGGMSYAGTNVSMRMLENQFLGLITRHRRMAKWVMKEVANFMQWPEASIRFKPFKMADDIQRKAFLMQLNQANKISDTSLLADSDYNQVDEDQIMMRETARRVEATRKQQLAVAEIQAESQVIMAKAQVKVQQIQAEAQQAPEAPGEPGGIEGGGGSPGGQEATAAPPANSMESQINSGQKMAPEPAQPGQAASGGSAGGVDIRQMAASIAAQLSKMSPDDQKMALENLQSQSPELADLVRQLLAKQPSGQQPGAQPPAGIDMRPLPEQRSPRRQTATV
jgi:hypothetical protein